MSTSNLPRTFFDPDDTTAAQRIYYFHDPDLIDAINIAIALGRPLLLTGSAGMGKTAVAEAVALAWGSKPLRRVINSRSEADDLKYLFDSVRRFNDASTGGVKDEVAYLTPGLLWCAYDPDHARRFLQAQNNSLAEPRIAEYDIPQAGTRRVVLIDELDKADLDFANDLLDIFDEGRFEIPYVKETISLADRDNLLVVITSNGERQFSPAFLRRCITYDITGPVKQDADKVARAILQRAANAAQQDSPHQLPRDVIDALALMALDVDTLRVARFADLLHAVIAFGEDDRERVLATLQRSARKFLGL